MECSTAAPYVSRLHDGESVPADAARHIERCADCREALRQWSELAAHLRLTAAADLATPLPALALPDRSATAERSRIAWWHGWRTPLRVPRLAAALVTAALVVSSVGWFRAESGDRVIQQFRAEVTIACDEPGGGRMTSTSTITAIVGSRSTFFTSDSCAPGGGLLGVVHPLSIANGVVKLRLGVRATPAQVPPAADLSQVELKDFDYVPGEVLRLSLAGSPTTPTFVGQIIQRVESNEPASMASLLPKADELAIAMPAILEDGKTVVVTSSAGSTARAGHAIAIYAPGHGLFVFCLDKFDGASEAQAGGGVVVFTSGGRRYTLYSSLPVTGGPQPRAIWVRHLADYRPSAHGGGADDLPGLRTGEPARLWR